MNARRILLLIMAMTAPAVYAQSARETFKEGRAAYSTGDYERAATAFGEAADAAQKERKLDAAVARYNQGNSLMRLGRPDEAASSYRDALRSINLDLQGRAYYNRGNALMTMAEMAEQQGQLDMAAGAVDEALTMYERAMLLNPRDTDPKINYELAGIKKAQLEELKRQRQQQQGQDAKDEEQNKEQQDGEQGQQQENGEQQQAGQPEQEAPEQPETPAPGEEGQDQAQQVQPQPGGQETPEGEMTPEEARLLLDAMRQREQADRANIRLIRGQPTPVEKDW